MANIIGSGRVKMKISQVLGNYQKKSFEKFIYSPKAADHFMQQSSRVPVDIELVTFVNSASIPDLLLTISSFLKAVAVPRKWTLYADDEFSIQQKNILSSLSFVQVIKWNETLTEADKIKYANKWQLRKFAAYAGHAVKGTTIFLDSDVLFYPVFKKYSEDIKINNWYLPEPPEANNIDDELIHHFDFKRQLYLVNAGFFIINKPPDWKKGFEYIDHCIQSGKEHYFLDQSALNIIYYHDSHARILDPRVFHASADDQFHVAALKTAGFAIRHYVGLIRHKMWQLGWKQFFK